MYSVIYKLFFFNPYPKFKTTPVSECLQGLSSCSHACMECGDGSRRCDHNSSSADQASVSLDLKVSIEGAHAIVTGRMLHIRIV